METYAFKRQKAAWCLDFALTSLNEVYENEIESDTLDSEVRRLFYHIVSANKIISELAKNSCVTS